MKKFNIGDKVTILKGSKKGKLLGSKGIITAYRRAQRMYKLDKAIKHRWSKSGHSYAFDWWFTTDEINNIKDIAKFDKPTKYLKIGDSVKCKYYDTPNKSKDVLRTITDTKVTRPIYFVTFLLPDGKKENLGFYSYELKKGW